MSSDLPNPDAADRIVSASKRMHAATALIAAGVISPRVMSQGFQRRRVVRDKRRKTKTALREIRNATTPHERSVLRCDFYGSVQTGLYTIKGRVSSNPGEAKGLPPGHWIGAYTTPGMGTKYRFGIGDDTARDSNGFIECRAIKAVRKFALEHDIYVPGLITPVPAQWAKRLNPFAPIDEYPAPFMVHGRKGS